MKTFLLFCAALLVISYGSSAIVRDVIKRAQDRDLLATQHCATAAANLKASRQLAPANADGSGEWFSTAQQRRQEEFESEYRSLCAGYGPEL